MMCNKLVLNNSDYNHTLETVKLKLVREFSLNPYYLRVNERSFVSDRAFTPNGFVNVYVHHPDFPQCFSAILPALTSIEGIHGNYLAHSLSAHNFIELEPELVENFFRQEVESITELEYKNVLAPLRNEVDFTSLAAFYLKPASLVDQVDFFSVGSFIELLLVDSEYEFRTVVFSVT